MENRKRKLDLDTSQEIVDVVAKKQIQNSNNNCDENIIVLNEESDEDIIVLNKEIERKESSSLIKPPCEYGSDCYRKNPVHLSEYSHPPKVIKPNDGLKLATNHIYLSKLIGRGISEQFNSDYSLSLNEILSMNKSDFVESIQFNYMFDLDWLLQQYPAETRSKPLTLVFDNRCEKDLKIGSELHRNVRLIKAKLSDPYGTHHTKMMFLIYKNGMRIVIHTANLIQGDWALKTQGIWLSHLFPKLSEDQTKSKIGDLFDSVTGFKKYLIMYLEHYESTDLNRWIDLLKCHDMIKANVFLVGSVPGRMPTSSKFGHLRLRKVLSFWPSNDEEKDETGKIKKQRIIAQFSSIGSLGPTEDNWLCNQFYKSLSSCENNNGTDVPTSKPICIYPTVENVKRSFEGLIAGGSLPYSKKTADRQEYLNDFLYRWKSDTYGRTRASPHIKSYSRYSNDFKKLYWFLLTSANLSKAAWGCYEKKDTQFFIRSYEMGVLLLPKFLTPNLSKDYFELSQREFLLPFDVPPVKYNRTDKPWVVEEMNECKSQ